MIRYSVQPRGRIFVRGNGFLSFARDIGKNISKNISSKYSQRLPHHGKQSAIDPCKTDTKRVIQKTANATGNLIENKTADKITRVGKSSSQNNLETIEKEIPRERYISPEQRQNIIDNLRLI